MIQSLGRSRKRDRGKTVTKPGLLSRLGLASSEKQIPQVVEKFESGDKRKKLWNGPNCAQGRAPTHSLVASCVSRLGLALLPLCSVNALGASS
jgi:hypothetical protein